MKNSLTISIAIGFYVLNFLLLKCDSRSIDLTEKETDCFSQNKIYHPEKDKCFKLLTRGPCEPGFWYVLEKPEKGPDPPKISAVCLEEKCPEGGFYWVKTKTCVQPKDKKNLCGSSRDEELLNNVFGEGECVCTRDPMRTRLNGDENNKCHLVYSQGPCRRGQVLGFVSRDPDEATCIEDKCYEETIKRRAEGNLSRYGVLAPWYNGSCYELGTRGPCPESLTFKVHEMKLRPDCIMLTNAIFDLERPQICFQDENGDCQKKINNSRNADKYREELLSALSSARRKRSQ